MKNNLGGFLLSKYMFPIYLVICVLVVAYVYTFSQDKPQQQKLKIEFRTAETEPSENLAEYIVEKSGEKLFLHNDVLSSNEDIEKTSVHKQNNNYSIFIDFTEDGTKKWAAITKENIGKHIAIIINDKLISAPLVRAEITQGKAMISGDFTKKEAEKIANGIVGK